MNKGDKYKLAWGIWKKTITSRDLGEPRSYATRDEAIKGLEELRDNFAQYGYTIWFATLYHPDGTKENLA